MGAAGAMVFLASHPARAEGPAVFQALQPTGRLGRLKGIADGALHLTSDGSTFFTKAALVIDAGSIAQ